jgi:phage terminase small subunit
VAPLENRRHEAFARELAAGKPASEAYVQAGYKPDDGNACRLTGNDKIKQRVAELQGKAAARVEITAAKLLADLEGIKQQAEKAKQFSAAARAAEIQAKLAGFMVEKREVTNVSAEIDFTRLTDADRKALDGMQQQFEKVIAGAVIRKH